MSDSTNNGNDEVINFYTLPRIKKKLPTKKDEQQKFTGMKIDSRFLIAGISGAGKTNALMNYLIRTSEPKNGTFQHIFLCNKLSEVLYEDLIEQCKDSISVYNSLGKFPDCSQFPDQTEKSYLVIFDGCVTDKDRASVKKIDEYFAFSRKKGITTCFITQSYFDTPEFIRKNMMYLLLLTVSGKTELFNILRDHNFADLEKDQLKHIYEYCTKKASPTDMPFMKIDCTNVAKDKKISRNFTNFIDLE